MYYLTEILPSIPYSLIIQELKSVTHVHFIQEGHPLTITKLYGKKIEAYNLVTIIEKMPIVSYPAANIYHLPLLY